MFILHGIFLLLQIINARYYNPWFVYFLPTFWSQKTFFFEGAFFLKNSNAHIKLGTYRTRTIITRGLYTFYPLFEVHLCTLTFGLMYG